MPARPYFGTPYVLVPSSFLAGSLEAVALDAVSLFTPMSLDRPFLKSMSCDMGSWAKAAGATARLSQSAAAEMPSPMRVLTFMGVVFPLVSPALSSGRTIRDRGCYRGIEKKLGARIRGRAIAASRHAR